MTSIPRVIAGLLAATALPVAVAAPAAAATPRSPLTISSHTILDRSMIHLGPGNGTAEGTTTGTFVASGAITDSGAEHTDILFSSFGAPDLSSNHGTSTLTGTAGSITLQFQSLHHPFSNPVFDGSWVVVAATGAYAGLHGTGTVVFSVTGEETETPMIDETWSGSVQ